MVQRKYQKMFFSKHNVEFQMCTKTRPDLLGIEENFMPI